MPTSNTPRGDSPAPAGGARPLLVGTGERAAKAAGRPASILDALKEPEPARAAPARSAWPWMLGGLGVAALMLLGWQRLGSSSAPVEPARQVAAAKESAPAPAPTPAPAPDPATARIEELPKPAAAAPAESAGTTPVAASPAAAAAPLAASMPAETLVASAPKRKKPRPAADDASSAKASTVRTAAAPANRSATVAATQTATTVAATPRPAARSADGATRRDSDVEIMTALMSHLDGKLPPTAAGNPAGAATVRSVAPEPAREAVSIVDLVQACRAKPNGEALACKYRICKGYWGKADACPASERAAARTAARNNPDPS